ncbi:unnamed protein product [Amoebophrya sp. A25]|nr:unnamed protein product [Amoebophrya sp. A25]|eukprot:GSA25T00012319001.1
MLDLLKPEAHNLKRCSSSTSNTFISSREVDEDVPRAPGATGLESAAAYHDPSIFCWRDEEVERGEGREAFASAYELLHQENRARFVQNCQKVISNTTCSPLSDLVDPGSCILLLGRPGSGKTTIIRDIAHVLSVRGRQNVIVVDTSNEICGHGIVPHPAVGMARRMMVPDLDRQASVLIEAVQNHTPDVIICDEIGPFRPSRSAVCVACQARTGA